LAVYVDEPVWEWRGRRWCHLLADDEEELHAFAARLGLRRAWFQTTPGRPWKDHYDLPEAVRLRAVELGATELTFREAARALARRRAAARGHAPRPGGRGPGGPPEGAV
jgi:hypothetical protein